MRTSKRSEERRGRGSEHAKDGRPWVKGKVSEQVTAEEKQTEMSPKQMLKSPG